MSDARCPRSSQEAECDAMRTHLSARGASPLTIKQYAYAVRRFRRFTAKPAVEVSNRDLDEWAAALRAEGLSIATVRVLLTAVIKLLDTNGAPSTREYQLPHRGLSLPRCLTQAEARQLLSAARNESDPTSGELVQTLLYSGLRVGELSALTTNDVNAPLGTVTVHHGKGAKDRVIVIDTGTVQLLAARARRLGLGPGERLFALNPASIERRVSKCAKVAGLPGRVSPHTLRHTLATALLSNGCDIRYIQRQLGHASLATTQIYTHVDASSLRAAYNSHLPRFGGRSGA